MASIMRYKNGYRIQFLYEKVRYSKVFRTKKECTEWYLDSISSLKNKPKNEDKGITLKELLINYLNHIKDNPSIKKGYSKHAYYTLNKFIKNNPSLVHKTVNTINILDINEWINISLTEVKSSTINKSLSYLKNAYKFGLSNNQTITNNLFQNFKSLKAIPHRDRLITKKEINIITSNLSKDEELRLKKSRVIMCFLFALQTGLRAHEIVNLRWNDINIEDRILKVNKSKTYTGIRIVPLTNEAINILKRMNKLKPTNSTDSVFKLENPHQVATAFIDIKRDNNLHGFTFHDARANAITYLASKLDVLDLARIVGHSNVNTLMIYYRKSIKDIAKELN